MPSFFGLGHHDRSSPQSCLFEALAPRVVPNLTRASTETISTETIRTVRGNGRVSGVAPGEEIVHFAREAVVMPLGEWLSIREAATEFSCGKSTLWKAIYRGDLPCRKVGGHLFVTRQDMRAFRTRELSAGGRPFDRRLPVVADNCDGSLKTQQPAGQGPMQVTDAHDGCGQPGRLRKGGEARCG